MTESAQDKLEYFLGELTELRMQDPGVALGEAIEILCCCLILIARKDGGKIESTARLIVKKFHSLQLFPPV